MHIVHGTLVAGVVTTVTLGENFTEVEVLNRSGTAEIYFVVDGGFDGVTTPTVGGNDCYVVPATISSQLANCPSTQATEVKLISSGTPSFTVYGPEL